MKTMKLFGLGTLLLALVAVGCDKPANTSPASKETDKPSAKKGEDKDDHDDDDHGPGPHQGTILHLGKYHAEFVVDHAKKQATVYILNGDMTKPLPLKADKLTLSIKSPMFSVDLKAEPLEGEAKGTSSRFVGTHEKFGVEQEFEGTVSGDIDGKPRFGDFKEKAHDHGKEKK